MEIYENMTEIKNIKKNSKDYLKILVHMTFGPMTSRLTKYFLPTVLLFLFCSMGSGLFACLSSLDSHSLMKYGPFMGLESFMLINVFAILERMEVIKKYFIRHENIRIPYEIMSKKLNRKIRKLSKMSIVLVFLNYGLALFALITITYPLKYLDERSYLRIWICSKIPEYCWIPSSIFNVFYFISASVMVLSPVTMIYLGISTIFRIMLINDVVKTICSSKIPRKERYNFELYQKLVEQKLKICVMMHDQVIGNSIEGSKMISMYVIPFFIGCIMLGVSLMLEILTAFIKDDYIIFMGLISYVLCGMVSGTVYITIGQILEDESELIWYNLEQLPWYYMNKKNIEIYSVFLRKSEKPISLSSDFLQINFLVFVRIFKTLYSVAAFILRMSPSSDV